TGAAGFGGDKGPPASATLNHPSSVAVDSSGNVFVSDYLNQRIRKVQPSPRLFVSPTAIDFGGQSMGTTSPYLPLAVGNSGDSTLSVSGVSTSDPQFSQTNNCALVAAGATCPINVTVTPAPRAGPLNSTVPIPATLTITSNDPSGPKAVSLSATGE